MKMSSFTVTFSGTTGELETVFFPPLLLPSEYEWEICLLDFTTFNTIPNVIDGVNNELTFYIESKKTLQTVRLPTGTYEVDDIRTYLEDKMGGADVVSLRGNNNTLTTALKSIHTIMIDYTQPTIAPMLGFTKLTENKRRLDPNIWHESNDTVDIVKVNVIQVKCSAIHGSYKDGLDDHILHTFYPTVPPGFKIVEKPNNLIYLPVNVNRIDTIHIRIVDQDDNIINFRGEQITVRLHLKRRDV